MFFETGGPFRVSISMPLQELIENAERLVVATTFGSNVARLKTLAEAGVNLVALYAFLGEP